MANKSRTFYAKINSLSLLFKEVIALLCSFLLPRLIIGSFGSEYNGIISSITQFLSVVAIFRIGIAGAARFSMYKPLAEKDNQQLSSVVCTFQKHMRKTGLFTGIYIVLLSVVYPLLFRGQISFLDTFILVIALGSATFTQYIFGLTYSTILAADQKSYVLYIAEALCNVISTLLSCLFIFLKFSLPIVKIISSIVWVIQPVLIYIYVRHKYKINSKAPIVKEKMKMKNDSMVHSVANIVHENTDVWGLTIFSSKILISIYSIYNLVIVGLKQITSVFIGSLEAPFGDMFAKKEIDSINKNLNLYEYFSFGLASILYSVALVLIIPFVQLYTSGVTDANYVIPLYGFFVVFTGITYCLRIPYQTVVQAGGYYKETKIFAIIEAALNVLITFTTVPFIGLIGAAIGTIVANAFRTITYAIFIYRKVLNKSMFHFINYFIWFSINTISIVSILNRLLTKYAYSGWLQWVICGFISVIIAISITCFSSLVLYRIELSTILKKVFRLRRKK